MTEPERCFVDTNVWLYALIAGQDSAKSTAAATILRKASVAVSVQVINEVCVNLIRTRAMQEPELRELIESFFTKCIVVPLEQRVLAHASVLRERYSLSFWDSLIVSAAVASQSLILYSEDLQHGLVIDGGLRIINPFATT